MQQPPATPPGNPPHIPRQASPRSSPMLRAFSTDDDDGQRSDSMATTRLPSSLSSSSSPTSFPFGGPSMSPGFLSTFSSMSYPSPLRQHRRTPSQHREVKETLNAVSEFADDEKDGSSYHKINQYTIKRMIGAGSYGSVHLATDQYGKEYAVKEFSKVRLRKRARTVLMKRGPFRAGGCPDFGASSPAARFKKEAQAEAQDALYLIREEIAVMKKLNHPNLVELIEVLDDPDQDSLYMVMEMCTKGVIMDVGLGKTATPYDLEACRCWFRDLILGIEYLHEQNIIHRDIKPDNLLIAEGDVLKIGDFGVSEMFERADGMRTSKTAGSPAFLPPELCVPKHGGVDGPPCDIWSMGITLYCLRYGRIPFEHDTIVEIYGAINSEEVKLPDDEEDMFVDLMGKILNKDPTRRITMAELREHPWVTMKGEDPLLSKEENCANPVEPPNALELNHAFTQKMGHLLCVLKAIRKFKSLLRPKTQDINNDLKSVVANSVADLTSRLSSLVGSEIPSTDEVARLVEERRRNLRIASLHTKMLFEKANKLVEAETAGTGFKQPETQRGTFGGRESGAGIEARQPTQFLGIGTGGGEAFGPAERDEEPEVAVAESPIAADFDIYNRAFQSEVERIQSQGGSPTVYSTNVLERGSGSATLHHRHSEKSPSTDAA